MIYFDTSALIKAFIEEKGSELVKNAIGRQEFVATAKIAYVIRNQTHQKGVRPLPQTPKPWFRHHLNEKIQIQNASPRFVFLTD